LVNNYNITDENIPEKVKDIINSLDIKNYPKLKCDNTACDLWEFCDNTKWYWR